MRLPNLVKSPYASLVCNVTYALGNCVIGFFTVSWWFITVGAYYTVVAVTRYYVLQVQRRAKGDHELGLFVLRVTGIMMIVLSFCIVGMNILSAVKDRGTSFPKILMIAIAACTFAKIIVAIVGMVRVRLSPSATLKTLRNLSLADGCVSVFAMQRSMLVTFPGMEASEILLLNILTGTVVWIVVLFLGINLIGGKYTDMAKSKIVKANEKVAKAVTGCYKKIETGVVGAYTKIEDKFVDAYLTKDGETLEEAKERLKKEQK